MTVVDAVNGDVDTAPAAVVAKPAATITAREEEA